MTDIQRNKTDPTNNLDALESMFEWAETSLCPVAMRHYKPEPKQDTLDYVFEHVESFTCRQDEKEPDVMYPATDDVIRGHSLLEHEPEMYRQPVRRTLEPSIKPFGQRGDLVDYVFENVESYACNEAMPDDTKMMKTLVPPVSPDDCNVVCRPRIQNVSDAEDEIQLYFRPQREKRRRRKAAS